MQISEESGNDRKNRSWQKGRLLTRGVAKGYGLRFPRWRQKNWRKTNHLKFGKLAPDLIGQRDRGMDGKRKGVGYASFVLDNMERQC